jgi:hypothetical protein
MMISMKHYLWWMVKSTSSDSTVGYSKRGQVAYIILVICRLSYLFGLLLDHC